MPIPLLVWIIGGAVTALVGTAAVDVATSDDDDEARRRKAEADARAEAKRRQRQVERDQARSRFLAMRNDEILAFANAHGLSVDRDRLCGAPAESPIPRDLVFEAIEHRFAQDSSALPGEERQLRAMENDRAAIARLLAPAQEAMEARHA